jgi:hypothetical protein
MPNNQTRNFVSVQFLRIAQGLCALIGLLALNSTALAQIEPATPGSIEYSLTSNDYTWVQIPDTITNGSYVIDLLADRLNQPAGRGALGIVSSTAWDADYNQMAAMVDFGRGYSAGIVFSELSAVDIVPVTPGGIEPAALGSIEYSLTSSNYTWFQVPGTITNGTYVIDLLTNRLNQPAGRGALGIVSSTAWDADYNQMAAMVDFGRGYSVGIVFSELSAVDIVPIAFSQSISLNEDTSKAFSLQASDVEGDVLTYTVGSPSHGVLSGTAPNLVYQPDKNYFGLDSFTFSVNDGKSESAVATVSITILPVNDTPVAKIAISPAGFFLGSNRLIIAPNGAGISLQLDGSQSRDADNDPLSYSWKDGNSAIGTNAVVSKTFKAGVHTFTLQVNDGKAIGTASETVQIITLQNALSMLRAWVHDQKKNPGNAQQELIAALSSAINSVNQGNISEGSHHLADLQMKVSRLQAINPSAATKLLLATQEIINAMQKPGQLSSQSPQPKP